MMIRERSARFFRMLVASLLVVLTGCDATGTVEMKNSTSATGKEVSSEAIRKIEQLGFRTSNIEDQGTHYVVEGDIAIQKRDLERVNSDSLSTKQAVDPNFGVIDHGTVGDVTIELHASIAAYNSEVNAIRDAIENWNQVIGSKLSIREVSSGGDIVVYADNSSTLPGDEGQQSGCLAGKGDFPSQGDPGDWIILNVGYGSEYCSAIGGIPSISQRGREFLAVHEIGHTLGFRHTNWNSIGEPNANRIPRTPSSDANSVMNGGTAGTEWSGFSDSDIKATQVLYPNSLSAPSFYVFCRGTGYGGTYYCDVTFTSKDPKAAFITVDPPSGTPRTVSAESGGTTFFTYSPTTGYRAKSLNYKQDFSSSWSN